MRFQFIRSRKLLICYNLYFGAEQYWAAVFAVTAWKQARTIFQHPAWKQFAGYMQLPSYANHLGQIPVMKEHIKQFCELVEIGQNQPGEDRLEKRLVVYIDNLDRCSESKILETLDATRLVMELPGVLVVIAIDPGILIRAATCEKHGYGKKRGSEYLDKIFQLIIHLPKPSESEADFFIQEKLFGGMEPRIENVRKQPRADISKPQSNEEIEKPAVEIKSGDQKDVPQDQDSDGTNSAAGDDSTPSEVVKDFEGDDRGGSVDRPVESPPTFSDEEIKIANQNLENRPEDVAALQKWAKIFNERNPRTLGRMHNSHRLLRSMHVLDRMKFESDVLRRKDSWLLPMLFWSEYLNRLTDPKIREAAEQYVLRDLIQEEVASGANADDQTSAFETHWDVLMDEVTNTGVWADEVDSLPCWIGADSYQEALDYVKQVLLPAVPINEQSLPHEMGEG